tara:strand:+ start:7366 stop:8124 length:759 start_codon:yes stop_codon:yes gene_type:complete
MLEVLILSIVQGITEFIPISSSSHLIVISEYIDFENQSLSIDVSLHIGSFLAVISYFYKDVINFAKNKDLFLKIVVSSIPVIITGWFFVRTNIIENLRNIEIIGWTTIIFGILLFVSDKFKLDKNIQKNFNFKTALIIGFCQIASLIPGVSRSGIAITAARFLKFERFDATKISFLLSIPILAAVTVFGIKNIFMSENMEFSILNLFAILFSFIISFITIKYFIRYIKKFNLNLFVLYRIFLGLGLLFLSYS